MVIALVLSANQDTSATLATANQLLTDNTGTTAGSLNTTVGTALAWGEITAKGTTSAWQAAASSALVLPSGKGFFFDSNSLEFQQFVAGNWSAVLHLFVNANTLTADLLLRFWKYNSGTYTAIGSLSLTGQSFTTASAAYTFAAASLALANFSASGDRLYIDLPANITASTQGSLGAFRLSTGNQVGLGRQATTIITTPGFQPLPRLSTSPATLSFAATGGGSNPASQNSTLSETQGTGTAWTSSISYGSGSGWLAISPTSGTLAASGNQVIAYTCTTGSLAIGTYTATVTFTATNGGAITTTTVTFTVNYPPGLAVFISNVQVTIKEGSWKYRDLIDQQRSCSFTVIDPPGTVNFMKGQPVLVTDFTQGILFSGYINKPKAVKMYPNPHRMWTVDCLGQIYTANKRTSNKTYANQYSGTIFADQLNRYLASEGVSGAFALDWDELQTDFAAGTLTNTVAATNFFDANSGDGDLELAAAGSIVTYNDPSLSLFSTVAVKMTGDASQGFNNNYCYRQIWSGSQLIASGDAFTYDVWISSTSPAIIGGMDFVCTDGTTFRDSALVGTDQQGFGSHPSTDLSGFANDQWYTRSCGVSGALIGKTIAYATVVFEGDATGTYTIYIRNARWFNGGTTKKHFFDSTQNTLQSNKQLQIQGYSNIAISVVNSYDKTATQTVGPHSISAAGIVRSSQFSWRAPSSATLDAAATITFQTSIDGGASYQPILNNASIPNLLPGMSVGSRNMYYQCVLTCGVDPTLPPSVSAIKVVVNPSYVATKSDVINTTTLVADWNLGTKTNTKTVSPTGLTSNGFTRAFSQTNDYNGVTTMFGNSANEFLFVKALQLQALATFDARSRLDFAGTWQNFTAEVDIQVPGSGGGVGLEYRTTNFGNSLDSYAYSVTVNLTNVLLAWGSNSAGAGSFNSISNPTIFGGLAADSWHHLKVVVSGSTHQIYLDDVLMINVTDTHWSAAGNISLRYYNSAASTHQAGFANFGVVSNLVGSWVSPSISLASATNYGNSILEWDTQQIPGTSVIGAETSIDGGTTYTSVTNGGQIAGLTAGQSLAGKSLLIRMTLTCASASYQPVLNGVTVWLLGQYNATGQRVSPAIPLARVGRAGTSLVNWNGLTPTNTTIEVDTSLDNKTTWQVVAAPGGAIIGITAQSAPIFDTFSSDTSANYANTHGAGGTVSVWAEDTANSRITATGGSSGLYISATSSAGNGYAGVTIGVNPGIGSAGSPFAFWTNLFADMAAQGLSTVRFQISWGSIELTQGVYTWTVLDDAVTQCNAAGVRIMYTIRGAPPWGLDPANGALLTNTEPFYIMSPTLAAGFATQVATRYDGTHGHGKIDVFCFNEDFSIHNTSTSDTLTLNGTVTAGVPITSFPITASGFTPTAGTKIYFGSYSSTDIATVSTDVALGDTTVHVSSFTPASTYTATQVLHIGYVGINTSSPYPGLFGSGNAVTTSNKIQPSRDFKYAVLVYTAVYNAIRAISSTVPIGLPVIWWTQPINVGGIPNTSVSVYTASLQILYTAAVPMDALTFIDFHHYSNNVDPTVGSNQISTISQAMTDCAAVASANGDTGREIIVSEFGYQANTVTTSSTTIAAGTRTITVASGVGSAVGGTCLIDSVASGVQETVTITARTTTTITAVFANAHTASYPVVINLDCDAATQATRYTAMMTAIQGANPKNQFMFFTMDYNTSGTGSGSSLVLWNGSSYTYQPAWTNVGSYITAHPATVAGNTAKDVDLFIDMDESDFGGLAWRFIDANNYYEMAVRDASSPVSAAPNTVQCYKMLAGTKTTIGPINTPISFTRGTYKRFRVTMLGSTITAYMDGVQLLSFTDTSIATAGQCGLRNDTFGGASTSRYYQLNILPLGDDVTSKTLYTRIKFTSSDPTVTPAMLDLQAFVSSPAIGAGVLVPNVSYVKTYVANNLQDLTTKANYWWSLDKNKQGVYQARNATPAPWILQSNDVLVDGLTLENGADLYRNRQTLRGVQSTQVFSKNFVGDGSSTSWTLDYPVASGTVPTISLDGQVQIIGVQGVDTGKQFYYTPGNTSITADASLSLLQGADTLSVSYTGLVIVDVTRDNTSFPNTITQSMMAAIEDPINHSTSGIVENVLDVTAMNLTVAAAQVYGDQLLQRYGFIGRTLSYRTLRTGCAAGQQQTAFVPEQNCLDVQFLVTSVEQTVTTGAGGVLQYWYAVVAMEGSNLGSWVRLFATMLSK